MLTHPDFYALKSCAFPQTFVSVPGQLSSPQGSGAVLGWPREQQEATVTRGPPYYAAGDDLAHPQKLSTVLANGLAARALPSWETPEHALPPHVPRQAVTGFLEVVDANEGAVQYLAVPRPLAPTYYNAWAHALSPAGFFLAPSRDRTGLLTCDVGGGVRKWEVDQVGECGLT